MSEVDSDHFQSNNLKTTFQYQNQKEKLYQSHQNKVVYVNSSDQFQDMEISRSQEFSKSFNDLNQQQQKNQNKINQTFKKEQTSHQVQIINQQTQPTTNENVQNKIQYKQQQHKKNISEQKQQNQENQARQINNQIQNLSSQPIEIIQPEVVRQPITYQPGHNQQTTQQVEVSNINQSTKPQIIQESGSVPIKQVDYEGLVSLHIFEKKINQSIQFKNKGNQSFKTSNYEDAIKMYSAGLRILDPQQFYGATQSQCQKMVQVSASLLYNIGTCYFNMNIWKSAQIYYTQTITINPNYIKALYKRALCRYQTQNYEGAMNDIKSAFNKDKSNVEVYKAYEKILQKYNQQKKKQQQSFKQISSKIFRKDSQKSLNQSQTKSQKQIKQEKLEIQQPQKQDDNKPTSDFWGFAPLVLVAGAALFLGYRKWFSK